MAGKQAKVLSSRDVQRMLSAVRRNRNPERDRVVVLLSIKAGLRAGEIAGLTWPMVLDSRGQISAAIELHNLVAKKGSGRRIPIHPALHKALRMLRTSELRSGRALSGSVVRSERGDAMRPGSIVNWFAALYADLGLEGCSSHSGRRTFVTRAARLVHRTGGSLRDVQQLAGHKSITMTQSYIDGDSKAQRRLVNLL